MDKKARTKEVATNEKKTASLRLQKEALRCLEVSQLRRVAGGGKLRVPVGVAEDTTPIYDDNAG